MVWFKENGYYDTIVITKLIAFTLNYEKKILIMMALDWLNPHFKLLAIKAKTLGSEMLHLKKSNYPEASFLWC